MALPTIDPRPDLHDEAETWSVDQLRAVQLERLQGCVRRACGGAPVGRFRRTHGGKCHLRWGATRSR